MENNYLKEFKRGPPNEHLVKIQSVVSEEKFFKEKVYGRTHGRTDGRTHDGHNAMTIACWPLASGAKNKVMSHNFPRNVHGGAKTTVIHDILGAAKVTLTRKKSACILVLNTFDIIILIKLN